MAEEEQTQEQAGQEQAQAQPEKSDSDAAVLEQLADGEPKRCTMTVSDFTGGSTAETLLTLAKLEVEGKIEKVRNLRMAQDGIEFCYQLKKEEPKQEAPSGEQQEAAAQPEGEASGSPHS